MAVNGGMRFGPIIIRGVELSSFFKVWVRTPGFLDFLFALREELIIA